ADGRALLASVRTLMSRRPDGLLCWNLEPPHPPERISWGGFIAAAAVAPARDLIAVAGPHREVELWEVGRPRRAPGLRARESVGALACSPDARTRAVAGGKRVELIDVASRQAGPALLGHRGAVLALAFAPDGRTLLSGGLDRSVRLWEVASGRGLAAWS